MKKHTLSILFAMLSLAVFAQHDYDNEGVIYSHGTDPHVSIGSDTLLGTFSTQQSVLQLLNTDGAVVSLGMMFDPLHRVYMNFNAFGNGIYLDPNASLSLSGGSSFFRFNGSGIDGGSVSIGSNTTVVPTGYKLAVGGKIITEEVTVQLETEWPDFVFHKNYDLDSLEEVEKHIEEKGHLKNVPSAKEVEENGISLGEMNAKVLQKVEELTLYMIELNKEVKELKEENKKLKALLKKAQ
ncbi:hypothetical protein KORDIASMS9_01415 [Kordia sp. SMS9]|uniref:hypothetical protein n=1 Tax=Kordia sp. SMS9 TaxID=2282170 RepID=UPI000E0D34EA|nr:hypothetical protein [Kordia sp. SMS9]AXG69195.1 hypothetical protein KORDIASMS9_01415 [Kordia sp. SMS9]